jgi:hypothetical protein
MSGMTRCASDCAGQSLGLGGGGTRLMVELGEGVMGLASNGGLASLSCQAAD